MVVFTKTLIRTGSPKLCYLFHTVTKRGLRRRRGDTHVPASLLQYDCLPRLVDSLLAEHPPFAFPASCGVFTSTDRRQFENFLGFEPSQLRRFWQSSGGVDAQHLRFDVPTASPEFKAVEGIFHAEPSVRRFYVPERSTRALTVESIERIENGLLQENMD